MKILKIVYSLGFGGAEKQVVVDANTLIGCGHDVTIAYNKKGDLLNLLAEGIHQHQIKNKNIILASLQMFFLLLLNRYDVVHSHMFWAEKISALPAKLTGHRIVFNEHGLGLWRRWYHILFMKFISLFAYKIITSCDANKKVRIERENLNEKKLLTVYNSFNELNKKTGEVDIQNFLNYNKFFKIGFVGRFSSIKRLNIFIELAEQLRNVIPQFKIILVGDGEEKEKIQREIKNKNLEKYFYLPGAVINVDQYYKQFDVFVLPSAKEACSVALLEAGASGVSAIVFDVGGNSEVIKDRVTGFVIPDTDIDALLEKIVYLYKNPEQKVKMEKASIDHIKSNFSLESRVKRLEKVYQEV